MLATEVFLQDFPFIFESVEKANKRLKEENSSCITLLLDDFNSYLDKTIQMATDLGAFKEELKNLEDKIIEKSAELIEKIKEFHSINPEIAEKIKKLIGAYQNLKEAVPLPNSDKKFELFKTTVINTLKKNLELNVSDFGATQASLKAATTLVSLFPEENLEELIKKVKTDLKDSFKKIFENLALKVMDILDKNTNEGKEEFKQQLRFEISRGFPCRFHIRSTLRNLPCHSLVEALIFLNDKEIFEFFLKIYSEKYPATPFDMNRKSCHRGYITILGYACSHEKLEIVKYLVEQGADVHKPIDWSAENTTPIWLSCDLGNLKLVKYFESKGAVHNFKNESTSSLYAAVQGLGGLKNGERLELVKHLINYLTKRGEDIKIKNLFPDGRGGLLHSLGGKEGFEIINYLISKGIDAHEENQYGQGPLEWETDNEVTELLLAHGATLKKRTRPSSDDKCVFLAQQTITQKYKLSFEELIDLVNNNAGKPDTKRGKAELDLQNKSDEYKAHLLELIKDTTFLFSRGLEEAHVLVSADLFNKQEVEKQLKIGQMSKVVAEVEIAHLQSLVCFSQEVLRQIELLSFKGTELHQSLKQASIKLAEIVKKLLALKNDSLASDLQQDTAPKKHIKSLVCMAQESILQRYEPSFRELLSLIHDDQQELCVEEKIVDKSNNYKERLAKLIEDTAILFSTGIKEAKVVTKVNVLDQGEVNRKLQLSPISKKVTEIETKELLSLFCFSLKIKNLLESSTFKNVHVNHSFKENAEKLAKTVQEIFALRYGDIPILEIAINENFLEFVEPIFKLKLGDEKEILKTFPRKTLLKIIAILGDSELIACIKNDFFSNLPIVTTVKILFQKGEIESEIKKIETVDLLDCMKFFLKRHKSSKEEEEIIRTIEKEINSRKNGANFPALDRFFKRLAAEKKNKFVRIVGPTYWGNLGKKRSFRHVSSFSATCGASTLVGGMVAFMFAHIEKAARDYRIFKKQGMSHEQAMEAVQNKYRSSSFSFFSNSLYRMELFKVIGSSGVFEAVVCFSVALAALLLEYCLIRPTSC